MRMRARRRTPRITRPISVPTMRPRPPQGSFPRARRGDRVELVAGAGSRLGRDQAGGQDHAGKARRDAGQNIDRRHDAVHPHARQPRRLRIPPTA